MSRNQPITTASIAQRNLKVVELQGRGEMKAALGAALETEQLAVKHLPASDIERAKALYNLGAIQTAVGDRNGFQTLDRALKAMKAAVGEQHGYYGRLLGLIASRHIDFGDLAKAELFYVKALLVLGGVAGDNASHLDVVVSDLTGLHGVMSEKERQQAKPEPPEYPRIGEAHFERSLQTQSMRKELDLLPPEIRDFAKKNLDGSREFFGSMSTHEVARAIIRDRERRGEPFALLLRGFEGEAYDYVVHLGPKLSGWPGLGERFQYANDPKSITEDPSRKMVVSHTAGPGKLELMLAKVLRGRLRAVTVASPASTDPGQSARGASLPRIILPDESWLNVVRSYIRLAHLIVVDGLGLNQGVRLELEAIVKFGKCDNTVIILHKGRSELDDLEGMAQISAKLAGGTLESNSQREWLTKEHPVLAPFKRIGYVDDLSSDNLASSPLFKDLLAKTQLARSITRLGITGTALIEAGNAADGALYLQASILLALGVPGWAERATVCFNLGLMYMAADQPEAALEAFTGCHTVATSTDDVANQGHALAMMGQACLRIGKPSQARDALVKSLVPLEAKKDNKYLERSLSDLAAACRALGEKAKAAAARAERTRLQKQGSWSLNDAGRAFTDFFLNPVGGKPRGRRQRSLR